MMEPAAEGQVPAASQRDLATALPPGYSLKRKEMEGGWITFTVRRDGGYVGSLRLLRYEDTRSYWLSRLYVGKAFRRLGIGRALIRVALQECRPWSVAGFIQSVGRNRIGIKRLRRFYTLCGAQIDESDVISWPATARLSSDGTEQACAADCSH
jgi:GNAT superfamily N-acetyltransferase